MLESLTRELHLDPRTGMRLGVGEIGVTAQHRYDGRNLSFQPVESLLGHIVPIVVALLVRCQQRGELATTPWICISNQLSGD